jgi:hypothetical protein
VLSDQCFPPVLPPEGEVECMKIIRIEDGGLMELVNAFTKMSKGFVIPTGSVILPFSTSRLFNIGTESYATEFDNAKNVLDRVMGGGGDIHLLHGLPILYTGISNKALIKSIIDLEHWFSMVHVGRDIGKSRKYCIKLTYGKNINMYCTVSVATAPVRLRRW